MAVTRRLVSQDNESCQILGTDDANRVVINDQNDWQLLFGPNSSLSNSDQVVKIAAELDPNDLSSIRFVAYLYNPTRDAIDNAATCTFKVYLVTNPGWNETLLTTFSGIYQPNFYFFADVLDTSLVPAILDGEATLRIEVAITRLGITYRDRIYVNHLGIYDSFIRLKKKVEFLDITKLDE